MISEQIAYLQDYCSDITSIADDLIYVRRKGRFNLRKYSKRRTFIDEVDINVRDFDLDSERSLDYYIRLFIEHTSAKGRVRDTLVYYEKTIGVWRDVLEEIGITTSIHAITEDTIRKFIHHYTKVSGNKYSVAMTQLRGVRTFANFLLKERLIVSHGFLTFPLSSDNMSEIDTFSELDVILLLEQCDTKTFIGFRNYMIILTML